MRDMSIRIPVRICFLENFFKKPRYNKSFYNKSFHNHK